MPSTFLTTDATKALASAYAKRSHLAVDSTKQAMQTTALALVRDMKVRMRAGGTDTVGVRSGNLRDQFAQETTVNGSVVKTNIGDSVKYARIQEYGGTIVPKNAQYLAIPVGPALTASGVPRYASPREVPGLKVIRSKAGTLLLVRMEKQGAMEVFFVLKKSVTLKPKLGLRNTITQFFFGEGSRFDQELKKNVSQVMRAT